MAYFTGRALTVTTTPVPRQVLATNKACHASGSRGSDEPQFIQPVSFGTMPRIGWCSASETHHITQALSPKSS